MRLLDYIYHQVISEERSCDMGLLHGRLGEAIFLFEYGRERNLSIAEDKAYELLQEVIQSLSDGQSDKNLGLTNGLFGIGCGIHYLYVNNFLCIEDPDDFFAAFDDLAVSIANNYPPMAVGYEGMVAVILYMVRRISHDKQHSRAIGRLKEHFIYLIDRLKGLLPSATNQREEVFPLLLEIYRYGYYKTAFEMMIEHLLTEHITILSFPKVQGYAGVGLQLLNKTVL